MIIVTDQVDGNHLQMAEWTWTNLQLNQMIYLFIQQRASQFAYIWLNEYFTLHHTGARNENVVQNHFNIALLNVF